MGSAILPVNFLVLASGTAAFTLCVGSYLLRTHRTLTLTAAAGVFCWAIHFAAKGIWTPAVMSLLMSLRVAAGVVVIDLPKKTRWQLTWLVWAFSAVGAALTWNGWVSAPSTCATLFLAWAGLHLPYRPLRFSLLVGECLWFLNGVATNSYPAMIAAVVSFCINLHILWAERHKNESPQPTVEGLSS